MYSKISQRKIESRRRRNYVQMSLRKLSIMCQTLNSCHIENNNSKLKSVNTFAKAAANSCWTVYTFRIPS